MKLVIATGGTGGHIFPALCVAEKFREKGGSVIFFGTKEGMEAKIVPNEGFKIAYISSARFMGKRHLERFLGLHKVIKGIIQSLKLLVREKPSFVLGMGGFVSFPSVLSAILLGIPAYIHEQNVDLGLSNRLLFRFVKKVFLSFEETARIYRIDKYLVTGNPVRKSVKEDGEPKKEALFSIFAFGGSRGARSINEAMADLLRFFDGLKGIVIYHQTGFEDFERMRGIYSKFRLEAYVFPFTDHMGMYYSMSDVVVSRAGSSTIFELASRKKPAILVPYPFSAGAHQLKNARYVERIGGGIVVEDEKLDGERLYEILSMLMRNRDLLEKMGEKIHRIYIPDSEDRIVNEILGDRG